MCNNSKGNVFVLLHIQNKVLKKGSSIRLDPSNLTEPPTGVIFRQTKMSLEYFAMTAIIAWIGKSPPIPWRWLSQSGPDIDPPLNDRFISNVYYVGLVGLILNIVATHPAEAFSLRYGPFMLVPTIQIVASLYQNNTAVPAATTAKAKM
jgi:hypothetical protein